MLKLIGSIMIGASCVYLGVRRSISFKKRYSSLVDFQNAISVLSTDIAFRETELKEAFINTDNAIFKEAAKYIENDGIKSAWSKAVKQCSSRLCLTEGDCDTVLMLGKRLGMTDTENQIKNLEGVKNMLDLHIRAASYDAERLCRLYAGGGVLTGLFLVLMLI